MPAISFNEPSKPTLAPDEVSSKLFGPGVIAAINRKIVKERIRLIVMKCTQRCDRRFIFTENSSMLFSKQVLIHFDRRKYVSIL